MRRLLNKFSLFAVCVSVLAAATVVTFSYVLRADRTELAGRYDVYHYFGPQAYYMDYAIHQGELPLWNPLTYCGMPFAANPQGAFFYPPNLIRSLLTFHPTPLKTQVGLIVLMALHVILAGTGAFYLARSHGLSYGASFTAAFAFSFSALMVRRVCEYHFISTIGWLPLLLLLVKNALSTSDLRRRLRYGLSLGLVSGIGLLGGFLQVAAYMAVTVGCYGVVYRLLHMRERDVEPKAGLARVLRLDALVIALACGVGLAAAAAMLLPAAELADFSARVGGKWGEIADYSPPISVGYLWQSLITYAGMKYEPETIRGAGVGVLVLALVALTHWRRRAVLLYAATFLVLLDCSLGPPFPVASLVRWVTPFRMVATTRAFDLALLPLSMLAGLGVDAACSSATSRWAAVLRRVGIAAAGAAMLALLATWTHRGYYLPISKFAIVVPAATVLAVVSAGRMRYPKAWPLVLAALVFGETFVWTRAYVPRLVRQKGFSQSAGAYAGGALFWQDNRRGADPIANRHLYALEPAMNGYDPLNIARVRQVLAGPSRGGKYKRLVDRDEVTTANQRGNLLLKRSFWLTRQYVDGPLSPKTQRFPVTTTVFMDDGPDLPIPRLDRDALPDQSVSEETVRIPLAAPEGAPFIEQKDGSRKCRLRFLVVDMPRVHTALRARYEGTCQGLVKTWFRDPTTGRAELGKSYTIQPTRNGPKELEFPLPDFSGLQATITIETQHATGTVRITDMYLLADQADEDKLITILERRPNSVKLDVGNLPGYRMLVFLDAAYPGWKAYVGGNEVPIYLADEAFKAIVLPPGPHHVEFVFHPWRVYAGMAVSSASVLAALGAMVWLLRGRRQASTMNADRM